MKLSKSRRLAAVLALALAVTGVTVPAADTPSKADTKEATATTPTGSAAKVDLCNLVRKTFTVDPEKQTPLRIQKHELADEEIQLEAYAAKTLLKKNSKIKIGIHDADDNNNNEMFVLYPNKLTLYSYDMRMSGAQAPDITPFFTAKNVKEIRKGSKKKATFMAKIVSGKTTSYVTYKLDFDKVKKVSTYTQTGKTYKKGSKKISKKDFNKFLKTYKKAKKLIFSAPSPYADFYTYADSLYMDKDLYVSHIGDEITVLRHDKDDTEDPYKAFTCANERIRYVFGKDQAADWDAFRRESLDPRKFIGILTSIQATPNEYDVSYVKDEAKKEGSYMITFSTEAGIDGDTCWEDITDESGAEPKIKYVYEHTSIGTDYGYAEYLYGSDADVDGEIYEPGSDQEAYAAPSYLESLGYTARVLKVDYAGTVKDVKTSGSYRFVPYTNPAKGKFTLSIGGKDLDYMDINLDTKEWDAAEKILNPVTNEDDYGQPTDTLKWSAK